MDRLSVVTDEVAGVPVAWLEGQIDKLAVEQARAQLDPLAAAGKLVIALDHVTFIDSAGLHALFGLGHVAAASGGRLAVSVPPTSAVARVVEIVRLADAMPVRESVEDAAMALAEVSAFDSGG
jgi:anti-anti-sigma factor